MTAGEGAGSAILTIPNAISLARLLLIPVFLWLLLGADQVAAAGWLLGFIGATDWVDGWLARRLDQTSEIGRMLDPIADRLAVAAALIGGLIAGVIPGWLGWGLIAREAVMGGVTGYLALRHQPPLSVRWWGKVATFVIYAAIACLFGSVGYGWELLEALSLIAGAVGLALYWLTAVQYIGDARRALRPDRVAPGATG